MTPVARTAPLAVGGVGGSGTRLVAAILRELGRDLGADVNGADDNLAFTLLFKWPGVTHASPALTADLWALFHDPAGAMGAGRPGSGWTDWDTLLQTFVYDDGLEFSSDWRRERIRYLREAAQRSPPAFWGWKEPNTHVVIDRLLGLHETLRYVHVMRNGLDMAFSENQTQLRLWGEEFLNRPVVVGPADSLAFWVAAHRRVERIAATHPRRVLFLNYDALCGAPQRHLPALLRFAGRKPDRRTIAHLARLIDPPASIGRHRGRSSDAFDPDDVAYVRHLGFDASP